MVTLYFCLDDYAPLMRYWPYVPRIGDTIALPEFGGSENQLSVYKVVCDGHDEPIVSVHLCQAEVDGHSHSAAEDGLESSDGQPS